MRQRKERINIFIEGLTEIDKFNGFKIIKNKRPEQKQRKLIIILAVEGKVFLP